MIQLPYWLTCPLSAWRIVWLRWRGRKRMQGRFTNLTRTPSGQYVGSIVDVLTITDGKGNSSNIWYVDGRRMGI